MHKISVWIHHGDVLSDSIWNWIWQKGFGTFLFTQHTFDYIFEEYKSFVKICYQPKGNISC